MLGRTPSQRRIRFVADPVARGPAPGGPGIGQGGNRRQAETQARPPRCGTIRTRQTRAHLSSPLTTRAWREGVAGRGYKVSCRASPIRHGPRGWATERKPSWEQCPGWGGTRQAKFTAAVPGTKGVGSLFRDHEHGASIRSRGRKRLPTPSRTADLADAVVRRKPTPLIVEARRPDYNRAGGGHQTWEPLGPAARPGRARYFGPSV